MILILINMNFVHAPNSSVTQGHKSGLGRLTVEISTSHTIRYKHTPGSTPLNTQQTKETNTHALNGIRTGYPSSQATALDRLATRIGECRNGFAYS